MAIQRGDYGGLSLPKLTLIALRLLSPYTQHLILRTHPLSYFSVPPPPTGGPISFSPPSIHHLGLPTTLTLPLYPTLITTLPAVLALSHTYWLTFLCRERMTLPFAIAGGIADLLYETISTLVFSAASINPLFNVPSLFTGAALYLTGIMLERAAEQQRASFKRDPANKGKVCDRGLWAVVRHPNYTANVLFGFGYGLACGGVGYAVATGGMYASNLSMNAGPALEGYMAERYGGEWEGYCGRVRWRMFPGIF